jgi:hypothetical protein
MGSTLKAMAVVVITWSVPAFAVFRRRGGVAARAVSTIA